ncbi:hypothetical protein LAZ67_7001341 [Cordylochernes scorpioides]|uniref:Uncharacterized protein n=1 Tax=Cordylochernes scorpioides TaxID=51811 RepID=A0ABY6KNR1_9ARAC|nr:hypothetical protein LAZ67_7001341 [Cordylochernes scorpioides]
MARRESQKLTREHDNTSWDYFMKNLKVTAQTIWKAIKRLSNSEKQEITLKTNNGQTLTTEEAAESFANNFEKQFTPNPYTSYSKPTRTYIKCLPTSVSNPVAEAPPDPQLGSVPTNQAADLGLEKVVVLLEGGEGGKCYCIKFSQKLGNSQVEAIRKIQMAFADDAMGITQIKE